MTGDTLVKKWRHARGDQERVRDQKRVKRQARALSGDLPALAIDSRDLKVEWLPINTIKNNPANARTHSKKQIKAIAKAIQSFGWRSPPLIDDRNVLVAGHARIAAGRMLGLEKGPIIRIRHLSREQVRAYAIADNRLAELAGWDRPLLYAELQGLAELSFDVTITGFDSIEIEALQHDLAISTLDEQQIPVRSDRMPVAQRGELYVLGKHRLYCGDATNLDDVNRLLDGAIPVLMVSDPPYGVDYQPAWRRRPGVNASSRSSGIVNDHRADWREAWELFPGNTAYIWHSALHAGVFQESLLASGFEIRAQIVWSKNRYVIGRGDFHWAHEPCWYAVRKGRSSNWRGGRSVGTVWTIPNLASEQDQVTAHATQKPIECMRRPIINNTKPGEAVYDPFVGSGTTIIAAERTGRMSYCMEIDPRYIDVAVQRWQAFTGRDAVHAASGKTFDELAEQRQRDASLPCALAGQPELSRPQFRAYTARRRRAAPKSAGDELKPEFGSGLGEIRERNEPMNM
jgi:DNA modification methylase